MNAELIVKEVLLLMGISKVWQSKFMLHIFMLFLSLRGRYTFYNMARYGIYSERTYRSQFGKKFEFLSFNTHLVNKYCPSPKVIVFDPSFIRKSGKKTIGLGNFWSGSSSKVCYGLEVGSFASVELSNKVGMHLLATQTILDDKNDDLMKWYINLLTTHASSLKKLSSILAVDAYFSKKNYVDAVITQEMTLVSRLRYDARLRYLFVGEKTGKRGRPKMFDGKVVTNDLDMNKVAEFQTGDENEVAYEGIIYADALKRKIKVVFVTQKDAVGKKRTKIFFSTDLTMKGIEVLKVYKARFQIEFIFRDAKQHVGLEQAQCRSKEQLDFHFNMALTTISLAKAEQLATTNEPVPFSMSDTKSLYTNDLLLKLFIKMFNIQADSEENMKKIKELSYIGRIAG